MRALCTLGHLTWHSLDTLEEAMAEGLAAGHDIHLHFAYDQHEEGGQYFSLREGNRIRVSGRIGMPAETGFRETQGPSLFLAEFGRDPFPVYGDAIRALGDYLGLKHIRSLEKSEFLKNHEVTAIGAWAVDRALVDEELEAAAEREIQEMTREIFESAEAACEPQASDDGSYGYGPDF